MDESWCHVLNALGKVEELSGKQLGERKHPRYDHLWNFVIQIDSAFAFFTKLDTTHALPTESTQPSIIKLTDSDGPAFSPDSHVIYGIASSLVVPFLKKSLGSPLAHNL